MTAFNITLYTADNGVMAKTFGITNGKVIQQHPGLIATGGYQTYRITLKELVPCFKNMDQNQALGLGIADLEKGGIVTGRKYKELGSPPDPIPRTNEHFKFRPEPTAVLFDIDGVDESIDVVAALSLVIPGFAEAEKLIASSSSSGLYLNGNSIKNSTSKHIYIVVKDGTDIPRFMRVLLKWLWIFGLGRIVISAAGTMLERSLIDPTVAAPERIIYEAQPVLNDGITQVRNDPKHIPGTMLDTSLLRNPTSQEESEYKKFVAKAKESHQVEADKVAREHDKRQAELVAEATGVPLEAAMRTVSSRRNGQIASEDIIHLNRNTTLKVSEITRDHHGQTCCDPQEPSYHNYHDTVAKIFVNDDGSVVINSYAHGGAKYHIRDADPNVVFGTGVSTEQVIKELRTIHVDKGKITVNEWFPVLNKAKLDKDGEHEVLSELVKMDAGKKRKLNQELKQRRASASSKEAMHLLEQKTGDRVKVLYAPYALNNAVEATEAAVLEVDGKWLYFLHGGVLCYAKNARPSYKTNMPEGEKPPKIPLIVPYDQHTLHLRIEQSVLHCKKTENGDLVPIATPQPVVQKLLALPDSKAPVVTGLVSTPTITMAGRIVFTEGIDEDSGLLLRFGGSKFDIPDNCTLLAAQNCIRYIHDTIFSEFPFASAGGLNECLAIALLLTALTRKVLDQAPGILVNASTQSSGKTTLVRVVHLIVTGANLPVSSLGSSIDEMKKEILSTLMQSPAIVCYDNLLEGSEINDPTLAKTLTATSYKGRILGASKEVEVPTNVTVTLTGNNISLSADMVRRFLNISLEPKEERPEERIFKHKDIVQHCLNVRRSVILAALTIIKAYFDAGCPLDNDNLRGTGFDSWDRMVRFPILYASGVDVADVFTLNRDQSSDISAMNGIINSLWEIYGTSPFTISDLFNKVNFYLLNTSPSDSIVSLRENFPEISAKALKSARSMAWVLRRMVGRKISGKVLKQQEDPNLNYRPYRLKEYQVN